MTNPNPFSRADHPDSLGAHLELLPPQPEPLFRKQALDNLLKEEDIREPLRVSPPWTWSLLWVMLGLAVSALAISFIAQVEMRSSGRGIVRTMAGVRLLQPGPTQAKVNPGDSPLQVVAFLAEKDHPYVTPGSLVSLELEAYPFPQFGSLKGKVLRVGPDLATPYEVREALGEEAKLDAPAFKVEIEILPERPKPLRGVTLRPGMLLQARFTLRRQRLLSLVFDPARQWRD